MVGYGRPNREMEGTVSKYEITIDNETFVVEVGDVSQSPVTVVVNGQTKQVSFREVAESAAAQPAPTAEKPAEAVKEAEPTVPVGSVEGEVVRAPMPGKILSVVVSVGDTIADGDTVCTLEAMKMEMPISSTTSGTVKAIHVSVGQSVAFDDPLVTIG